MKKLTMCLLVVLLAATIILSGCAKKEEGPAPPKGVDTTTPISELKTAAAQMDLAELEKIAMKYKDEIMAKKGELEKLTEQLKAIPMAEQLGVEAKGLQSDISDLTKALGDLSERLQVYVDYIKEKGGDIAKYKVD